MGGGTLTLQEGGGLGDSGDGQIDLSNSTLELAGPFLNDGGTLTTSASTLKLKANVLFRLGNVVTFDTYVPNGWGLLLYNNDNSSSTKSLTLGTNNSNITLEPNYKFFNKWICELVFMIITLNMFQVQPLI